MSFVDQDDDVLSVVELTVCLSELVNRGDDDLTNVSLEKILQVLAALCLDEVLGIVGESGSGKSVTTLAIMRLLPKNGLLNQASQINYRRTDGSKVDVVKLNHNSTEMRDIRGGEISMIFDKFSKVF